MRNMTNERIIEIAQEQGWDVWQWDEKIAFSIPDFSKNEIDDEIWHSLYYTPDWPIDAPLELLLREAFNQLYARTMFATRGKFNLKTEQEMMLDQAVLNSLNYLLTTIRESEEENEV